MKRHTCHFVWKRVRRVPKRVWIPWLISTILIVYCVIKLCLPVYGSLDELREINIHIDKIYLRDSHDTKGSRMKLVITEGKCNYYLWYPAANYKDFSLQLEQDLLSGKISEVTALVVSNQSLRETLSNSFRIVDLRSDRSVYYDLDTEKQSLRNNRLSLWIAFTVLSLGWVVWTYIELLAYNIISYKKKQT